VSGSGKTTFARQHFGPFEVISSDFCRGLVADDENDQAASAAAFDVLGYIAGKRLAAGRLTVVDATNVQPAARKQFVELARAHDVLAAVPLTVVAIAYLVYQGMRRVAAVESVNAAPEYLVGRKLIAEAKTIAPEKLADLSIPMKNIA